MFALLLGFHPGVCGKAPGLCMHWGVRCCSAVGSWTERLNCLSLPRSTASRGRGFGNVVSWWSSVVFAGSVLP